MNSEEAKEAIKTQCDLISIAEEEGVKLHKRGEKFQGLCPFHADKDSLSFTVYPATNTFHCFGCSTNGDVLTFIQKKKNLGFMDSLSLLGSRIGLSIDRLPIQREKKTELEELYNDVYQKGREELLKGESREAKEVIDFLCLKGFKPEDIAKLDMSVHSPKLRDHIKQKYSKDAVFNSGLCRWGFGYNYLLLFPHYGATGKIIGMIARIIRSGIHPETKTDLPKYNVSPSFDRTIPFNFYKAQKHIRISSEVFVLEGVLDVYSMVINGYGNSIGENGNRLMADSIELIKNSRGSTLFRIPDNDDNKAGINEAEKDIYALLKTTGIHPFFLEVNILGSKDMNDFFNPNKGGKTRDDFRLFYAKAVTGERWLAKRIIERISGNDATRNKGIEDTKEIYCSIVEDIPRREFLRVFAKGVKLPMGLLHEKFVKGERESVRGKEIQKSFTDQLEDFAKQVKTLIENGGSLWDVEQAATLLLKDRGEKRKPKEFTDILRQVKLLARRYETPKLKALVNNILQGGYNGPILP